VNARRGRPRGRRKSTSADSEAAILRAARELFASKGFRGTTTRGVARRARVDLALVHYFYATKAKLFAAAIELPVLPEQMFETLSAAPSRPGERMARLHLEHLFTERNQPITAMLRAAVGDPDCAPTLRALVQDKLVGGAASALSGPDARLRAELAGAQMVGLFVCRHLLGIEPLASTSTEELVQRMAPALDAVLLGTKTGANAGRKAKR
jgi:AcrR family transcriptional regulator